MGQIIWKHDEDGWGNGYKFRQRVWSKTLGDWERKG
jgi:hypothetical protein